MDTQVIIVETTVDDEKEAQELADALLEHSLAACIQINAVESVFTWKGKAMRSDEWVLRIKTHRSCWDDIEAFIQHNHPYDEPELIATPVIQGSSSYLNWVRESVS